MRQVFASERAQETPDADASLYHGFLAEGERRKLAEVRGTPPAQLGTRDFGFKDGRLQELLFRYRARNWPETLDAAERARWDDYRRARLAPGTVLAEQSLPDYLAQIAQLRAEPTTDGAKQVLLDRLEVWGRELQIGL